MLNLCLTFDHELFLGENFVTEKEILIDTTDRLLNVLEKHQISGTFFTDVCSIMRYTELGMNEFPNLMKDQLKRLIRAGQDVQLHIHSNWLKSIYSQDKWRFNKDSYRVQYFTSENSKANNNWTMKRIVKEGKQLLENLLKSENTDYACIAYRAGGFCIQPEEELIACLIENGIFIDSSIAPGVSALNCINNYDFRNTPGKVMNWFISPSSGINKIAGVSEQQKLFEVPVATVNRDFFKWVFTKRKNINTRPLRGGFISYKEDNGGNTPPRKDKAINRLLEFFTTPVALSLDYYDAQVLYSLTKKIYKKYKCNKNDIYISIICHPKLVNDELVDNLERYIEKAKANKNIRFCNMKDIYGIIRREEKSYEYDFTYGNKTKVI